MMLGNSCLSLATVSHHKRLPTLPMNTLQQHPRKDRIFHQHLLPHGHKSHNSARLGWHSTEGPHLGDSKKMQGKKQTRTDWRLILCVVWRQHLPDQKRATPGSSKQKWSQPHIRMMKFPPSDFSTNDYKTFTISLRKDKSSTHSWSNFCRDAQWIQASLAWKLSIHVGGCCGIIFLCTV